MLNKNQSISARLSADDYAYLMTIDRNGAVTQSEKLRELIAMARESVGVESFARAYLSSAEAMLPLKARYKEESQRSVLVEATLDFLAESAALLQVCADEPEMGRVLEQKLIPALEELLERVLPVARQEKPRTIAPDSAGILKQRISTLLPG